jgi:hypothetical protein
MQLSLFLSLSGRSPAGTSGPGEPGRCPGHHESSRLLGLGRGRPQSERFRVWPQSERFRVSDRPGRPGRGVYTVTNRPSPAAIRSPEAKLAPGTERACDAAGRPWLRRRGGLAGPARPQARSSVKLADSTAGLRVRESTPGVAARGVLTRTGPRRSSSCRRAVAAMPVAARPGPRRFVTRAPAQVRSFINMIRFK